MRKIAFMHVLVLFVLWVSQVYASEADGMLMDQSTVDEINAIYVVFLPLLDTNIVPSKKMLPHISQGKWERVIAAEILSKKGRVKGRLLSLFRNEKAKVQVRSLETPEKYFNLPSNIIYFMDFPTISRSLIIASLSFKVDKAEEYLEDYIYRCYGGILQELLNNVSKLSDPKFIDPHYGSLVEIASMSKRYNTHANFSKLKGFLRWLEGSPLITGLLTLVPPLDTTLMPDRLDLSSFGSSTLCRSDNVEKSGNQMGDLLDVLKAEDSLRADDSDFWDFSKNVGGEILQKGSVESDLESKKPPYIQEKKKTPRNLRQKGQKGRNISKGESIIEEGMKSDSRLSHKSKRKGRNDCQNGSVRKKKRVRGNLDDLGTTSQLGDHEERMMPLKIRIKQERMHTNGS